MLSITDRAKNIQSSIFLNTLEDATLNNIESITVTLYNDIIIRRKTPLPIKMGNPKRRRKKSLLP